MEVAHYLSNHSWAKPGRAYSGGVLVVKNKKIKKLWQSCAKLSFHETFF
jgi:hypothetical protein